MCLEGSYLFRTGGIALLAGGAARRYLSPKLIGAAVGGLASLAGFTVLELNCPDVNVFHIVVWHWGVVLIGTASGALIGTAAEYIQQRRHSKTFRAGGLVR